jgi:hypothetical protein
MAATLLTCPSIEDETCPAYIFSGFVNGGNKYGSVTICDWDCCLFGVGTTSDSVYVEGYGTLNQPTPPKLANCATGENIACSGVDSNLCPSGAGGWDGKVDGHIVYKALNSCQCIVIEATGSFENQLGDIVPIPDIPSILGPVQSDIYAYSFIADSFCGNADQSNIFIVLGDPSPDNT